MASISAQQFFGGKVPPAPAPVSQAHPLDGYGVSDAIKSDFTKRLSNVSNIKGQLQTGKQGLGSSILQSAGQVAGFGGDVLTEGLKEVTPQPVKEAAKNAIGAIADTEPIHAATQAYKNWKQQHPEAAANLEAAVNIGSLLPVGGGVSLSVKGAERGAQVAGDVLAQTAHRATDIAERVEKGAKAFVETPTPKSVESVLKETPTQKFDTYVQAAKKATENNKNATPLEIAGQHAQTALDQIQSKVQAIGKQKSDIMKSGGLSITPIKRDIVGKFNQGLQQFRNAKTTVEGDTKLIRDVSQQAKQLGATPSAGQVDRFIDFVQSKIYTSGRDLSVPVTNETIAALRNITGNLNNDLKAQLPDVYKKVNQQYSDMLGIRDELNTKLGKDGEKGGALMKRVFSPSDANTKKLFADVLKHTGIDLTNEATLARYVMDVMGDTRQKSMLDELNLLHTSPTPSGAIGKLVDYTIAHFNTPDEIIGRARSKTAGSGASSPTPKQ